MSIQPIRKYVGPEIPDKLYFRIGDVARLCEVPAYVLRFWETEFAQLRPNKGGTGQRLYRKRDVETALRIKSLLYDQGYTITGARQVFKNEAKERETVAAVAATPQTAATVAQAETVAASAVSGSRIAVADRSEEMRRKAQLRAVRDELCALQVILEHPLRSSVERPRNPAPKLQAMRPRLMIEPKPAPVPAETLRLVGDARAQGDLFAIE